jgi:hypothetical protein
MNYDVRARATAARMLSPVSAGGKGQLVTLTKGATTQYGAGVEEAYSAFSIDGSLIKSGDKRFLLSALKFNASGTLMSPPTALTAPVVDETTLTFADASIWRVKRCDLLAPAGLAILFQLQLRPA